MKSIRFSLGVAAIAASTWVCAQGNAGGQPPDSSGTPHMQPEQAGKSMNRAADAGAGNGNAEGSLMQKRSNAMSPQGASTPGATGTMKQ